MVRVVSLDNLIGVEVVIRAQVVLLGLIIIQLLLLFPCPLNILLATSKILVVINQTQDHIYPVLFGLSNHKV